MDLLFFLRGGGGTVGTVILFPLAFFIGIVYCLLKAINNVGEKRQQALAYAFFSLLGFLLTGFLFWSMLHGG